MALFLGNAFSLGMLEASSSGLTLRVRPLTLEEVKSLLKEGFVSAVGHQATADILISLLGTTVPCNRVAIKLAAGDKLIVFQLQVRLEEGKILSAEEVAALYREGKATFWLVEVVG
jgi:phage terminase large subunit-like protein